jgi:hypothetical protein
MTQQGPQVMGTIGIFPATQPQYKCGEYALNPIF